ncbi:hypothetical protein JST97_24460 [bacterium]|nr:hypothetical protein [bacterium]
MLKRVFLFWCLGCVAWAQPSYRSQGLSFQLPLKFSQPARAGLGAEELHFPAGEAPAQAEILTFVAGSGQVRSMAEAGQSIDRYFVSTYLGLTGQPEQINKAVIGDLGGRHLVYHSTIPRSCRVDVFERELPDGRFVAVALRSYEMSEEQRIQLSESLRKTLKID